MATKTILLISVCDGGSRDTIGENAGQCVADFRDSFLGQETRATALDFTAPFSFLPPPRTKSAL